MDEQNLMGAPLGSQGDDELSTQGEVSHSPADALSAASEPIAEEQTPLVVLATGASALEGATTPGEAEDAEDELASVLDETRTAGRRRRTKGVSKRRASEPSQRLPVSRREPAEETSEPGDSSGYVAPHHVAEDEAQWYVVHCYSGYENKVKSTLEQRIEALNMADRIFEVIVPTEEEIEVREGKRRAVQRQVLPGYVIVRMKMSEETWQVVRNTPGVTRFVGMGNRPQPLDPQEVEQILQRMQAGAPRIKVNFRPGQKVRITEGPFADFMGIVDRLDTERAKVTVLVSFFGRETPVELDFFQVERV